LKSSLKCPVVFTGFDYGGMDLYVYDFFHCVLLFELSIFPLIRSLLQSTSVLLFSFYSLRAFSKNFFLKNKKRLWVISLWSWRLLIYFTVVLPSEIMGTSFTVGKNFSLVGAHHRSTVILSNGVISRLSHYYERSKATKLCTVTSSIKGKRDWSSIICFTKQKILSTYKSIPP